MRGLKLPLNQTQRIRLRTALEKLESLSSKVNADTSVIVADSIPVNYEDAILKGHGTQDRNGEVVATLCGVVERINKLIYVRSLRARYKPEVGDIIVGRVLEVAQKRWKIEINYIQDAFLMLSSVNLPDGIQRRRTSVDELNMRIMFEENDVVCAEVRGFQNDGLHLQARSQKYGKLNRGQLLTVPPYLVKRQKQHFHRLEEYGIEFILGCNGFIWVGEYVKTTDDMLEDQVEKSQCQSQLGINSNEDAMVIEKQDRGDTPLQTRQYICRIANVVRVLSTLGFNITFEVVKETIDLSLSLKLDIHDILGSEFHVLVAEREVERRSANKRKR